MKSVFLACALSLPVMSFHPGGDSGGHNMPINRTAIINELKWLEDLLKGQYPGYEWLIIIDHENVVTNIPGWEWLPFFWRGHAIYRKKLMRIDA